MASITTTGLFLGGLLTLIQVTPSWTLSSAQLSSVAAELAAAIPTASGFPRVDAIGGMVRLPFHDAFGERTVPDGCLDPNEGDHNGLEVVRDLIDPICAAHAGYLSRADCWVIAGNVAIVAAGGGTVPFRFGRLDCANETASVDTGLLPEAAPEGNAWDHITAVFGPDRAGMSTREIVALMGAHSLGRPSSDPNSNSGFTAVPWVPDVPDPANPGGDRLTYRYFRSITAVPWVHTDAVPGEWLHTPPGAGAAPDSLMLNVDMSLVINTSSCARVGNGGGRITFGGTVVNQGDCIYNTEPADVVAEFAVRGNEAQWLGEFAGVMQKMTELGYSEWSLGGAISSTRLCEVTDESAGGVCASSGAALDGTASPSATPITPAPTPEAEASGSDSSAGTGLLAIIGAIVGTLMLV